ncbi:MAG: class I SAM-dependent methyltransferase [Geminicoccaceae bacterium]
MSLQEAVVAHYGRGDLLARIEAGLRAAGKDPRHPTIDDLAPVDEFHARGREATLELAALLPSGIEGEVLDVGSGLGGPARFLARTRGLRVLGIDLTPDYVAVANELSRRCGLAERVRFEVADALALPFPPASFAAAYTQHVAMNIADKPALYAGIARVLRPGATFVVYDMLRGPTGEVRYPTPWSADGTTSFLIDLATLRAELEAAGFTVVEEHPRGAESLAWFETRLNAAAAPPPTGIHLLLGDDFATAFQNMLAGLRAGSLIPTFVRAVRR